MMTKKNSPLKLKKAKRKLKQEQKQNLNKKSQMKIWDFLLYNIFDCSFSIIEKNYLIN